MSFVVVFLLKINVCCTKILQMVRTLMSQQSKIGKTLKQVMVYTVKEMHNLCHKIIFFYQN